MTAGEYLQQLMSSHGLTSRRLAERTDGEVGESTIRNYLVDKGRPRAEKALAIARVFNVNQGTDLLRLWRYEDLAKAFAEGHADLAADRRPLDLTNTLTYSGEPLGPSAEREAQGFIEFLQSR